MSIRVHMQLWRLQCYQCKYLLNDDFRGVNLLWGKHDQIFVLLSLLDFDEDGCSKDEVSE